MSDHFCQECGQKLQEQELPRWASIGFYECFCSDHAHLAYWDKRAFYCKVCAKLIPVRRHNISFGSEDSYCDQHIGEYREYVGNLQRGTLDQNVREWLQARLFRYDYNTGKEVRLD
jgi:hypothetical protein